MRHRMHPLAALLILAGSTAAMAADWQTVASDKKRTIELDRASILQSDPGTKVAFAAIYNRRDSAEAQAWLSPFEVWVGEAFGDLRVRCGIMHVKTGPGTRCATCREWCSRSMSRSCHARVPKRIHTLLSLLLTAHCTVRMCCASFAQDRSWPTVTARRART